MLVDPQGGRLAVRDEADTVEAGASHALDDLGRRARDHMTPVPDHFDRRGEKRQRLGAGLSEKLASIRRQDKGKDAGLKTPAPRHRLIFAREIGSLRH